MTRTPGLDHVLERAVTIAAPRETVFRYFTDSARFAAWWGAAPGSSRRSGGRCTSSTRTASWPEERWSRSTRWSGWSSPSATRAASRCRSAPPGSRSPSRRPRGHRAPSPARAATAEAREAHVQGWRYQLAVFANVVAQDAHAGVSALADRFFALWGEADEGERRTALEGIALETIAFRDPYSCTDGPPTSSPTSLPPAGSCGVVLERQGEARQCQGTASWTGRSRTRTGRCARRARTSSSSRPTAASRGSPGSGADRSGHGGRRGVLRTGAPRAVGPRAHAQLEGRAPRHVPRGRATAGRAAGHRAPPTHVEVRRRGARGPHGERTAPAKVDPRLLEERAADLVAREPGQTGRGRGRRRRTRPTSGRCRRCP